MQSTPGPWRSEGHYILGPEPSEAAGAEIVAERVAEHNRALIAAAPALADALESVLGLVSAAQREGSPLADNALAVLRAAGRMLP